MIQQSPPVSADMCARNAASSRLLVGASLDVAKAGKDAAAVRKAEWE
jgi:hypothetical protein